MQFYVCLLCILVFVQFVRTAVLKRTLRQKRNSFMDDKPCGVEASPSLIHHNPWLVFLEYYNGDDIVSVRCAGTLIGEKHAVTAAHCVLSANYTRIKVRLGEYDWTSARDCLHGVCAEVFTINVANITCSPYYDGDGSEGDIAVLELETEAPYTDFIRPICLPTGQIGDHILFVAAGWGQMYTKHRYSKVKKIIPLPFWKEADCRETYNPLTLPRDVICAGGNEGMDTCNGDSGGPLVLYKEQAELWGVTSSGATECGTKNYPGIYTSVKEHLHWIYKVTAR